MTVGIIGAGYMVCSFFGGWGIKFRFMRRVRCFSKRALLHLSYYIADHFHEVPHCLRIISILKKKGYLVGLNVMQASMHR